LSRVQWQFLHWLLTEELTARDHPLVAAAITQCADVLAPLAKGQPVDGAAAEAAARAAEAAWAAAWRRRRASRAAARAAEAAAYKRMADKLIELLTEAR